MDVGRISSAQTGGISKNNRKQKAAGAKPPKDSFVKSSNKEADLSMENLSGKFSAGEAGSIVLGDTKKAKEAMEGTILDVKWKTEGTIAYESPLIYNKKHKRLFGGIEDNPKTPRHLHHLTCFKPDGTELWKYQGDLFLGGLAVDKEGNSYFGGPNALTAVDKEGKKLWSVPIKELASSRLDPVVSDNGTVYAISPNHDKNRENAPVKLTAIKNGKIKWTHDLAGSPRKGETSMTLGKDGTLYVAGEKDVIEKGLIRDKHHSEKRLIAFNPYGKEKFSVSAAGWGKKNQGTLGVGPDGSIATVQGNRILKVYSPEGKEILNTRVKTNYSKGQNFDLTTDFPPVIDGKGNIYYAGRAGKTDILVCLDKTGKEKWRHNAKGNFTTRVHITPEGKAAIASDDEFIYIFDDKGKTEKRFYTGGLEHIELHKRVKGEKSFVANGFDFDEKGMIYAGSGDWLLSFDGNADPFNRTEGSSDEKDGESRTIKRGEEKVVIGGVELPVNKRK